MWGGQGIPRYELKYVKRKVRVLYQWGKTVNKIPKAVRKENHAQVKKAKQFLTWPRVSAKSWLGMNVLVRSLTKSLGKNGSFSKISAARGY